jgi:hypothetical protein
MKIKKGCTAIVVYGELGYKSPNVGKIVKVENFVGVIEGLKYTDWWEVDKPMSALNGLIHLYYQREYNLDPINDEGEDLTTNATKRKEILMEQ